MLSGAVVAELIRRSGLFSILVLILSTIILLSFLSMTAMGVSDVISDVSKGEDVDLTMHWDHYASCGRG